MPAALSEAMRTTTGREIPKTLLDTITIQLRDRTALQLRDRVLRRWESHNYRATFEAGALTRPVGAAVTMLRHGPCPGGGPPADHPIPLELLPQGAAQQDQHPPSVD
ncbi:hypothetical protein [Streptomyces sp. NPDC051776]|uniref:hypothetical protein n=1 Tax=Streptomyces sp. NPDC051776 TaxID=3155414 RepID=UPI003423E975